MDSLRKRAQPVGEHRFGDLLPGYESLNKYFADLGCSIHPISGKPVQPTRPVPAPRTVLRSSRSASDVTASFLSSSLATSTAMSSNAGLNVVHSSGRVANGGDTAGQYSRGASTLSARRSQNGSLRDVWSSLSAAAPGSALEVKSVMPGSATTASAPPPVVELSALSAAAPSVALALDASSQLSASCLKMEPPAWASPPGCSVAGSPSAPPRSSSEPVLPPRTVEKARAPHDLQEAVSRGEKQVVDSQSASSACRGRQSLEKRSPWF